MMPKAGTAPLLGGFCNKRRPGLVEELGFLLTCRTCIRKFVTDSEKEQLIEKLQEIEDWLYEDGMDETKDVYSSKLDEIKKLGDPAEEHYKESTERGIAIDQLHCIKSYMEEASSKDPKFNHIDAVEKDKGGYVLYRLFKKLDDKSSISNCDAVERSDFSPTPSMPSPCDTQQDPDASEEFATPVNQDSPQSDMQEAQQALPSIVDAQPAGIERGLADKSDCSTTSPAKPEESHHNDNTFSDKGDHKAEGGKVDSLLNVLLHSRDPQFEWTDSDGFPTISSPMLPYADYPFFGNVDQGSDIELYEDGNAQDDPLNKLLRTVLSNQDDYSASVSYALEAPFGEMAPDGNASETCVPISNSAPGTNGGWDTDADKNAGLAQALQGSTNLEYSDCFGRPPVLSNSYSEMEPNFSNIYENTSFLSHDIPGTDDYSFSESLQELLNDMEDPSWQRSISCNDDGLVGTGIKIMARESQNLPNSNLPMHLDGERRIRLQCWTDVETFSCEGTTSSDDKDDNENKVAALEEEKRRENINAERSFSCESTGSSTSKDNDEDKVEATEVGNFV